MSAESPPFPVVRRLRTPVRGASQTGTHWFRALEEETVSVRPIQLVRTTLAPSSTVEMGMRVRKMQRRDDS
ncbi:hypothetical protein CPLU01_09779 [Colletotrichum plurivorum]|uniref:Uncharacterized protein n=1 Tax=Colletotrichum plurivorum TaxID=2175906 RepID=A0A8H6K7M5_9PEZI|nr:hypothetical protein CPLU01_09779 [Colletotrichum plurivorum]